MKFASRSSHRLITRGAIVAILTCLCAASPALAATGAPADIATLLACRTVKADQARLQCFDRESAAVARLGTAALAATPPASRPDSTATSATAEAPPAAQNSAAAALDPRRTFGLSASDIVAREVKAGVRRREISSMTVRIAGLGSAPDGRMIYSLDDGQVWEELLADGEAPLVRRGEQVQISRGALGSYWMQTRSGRGCKVLRLR